MTSPPAAFVLSGAGEFLARRVLEPFVGAEIVSLSDRLSPDLSAAACAHAVAILAAEERHGS